MFTTSVASASSGNVTVTSIVSFRFGVCFESSVTRVSSNSTVHPLGSADGEIRNESTPFPVFSTVTEVVADVPGSMLFNCEEIIEMVAPNDWPTVMVNSASHFTCVPSFPWM